MFARIAARYDFLNHLLSGTVDRRWRRLVAKVLESRIGQDARVADIACGTGDLAIVLSEACGARVVAVDFCRPMLEIATRKAREVSPSIDFLEGDALHLPFEDGSFDAATIAFGLRNLSDVSAGLSELRRILRPGGLAIVLEFSRPVVPGFRKVFQFYFSFVLPRVGGLLSGSRGAYEYLPDSVASFPDQETLATLMREAGFENVEYRNLTGGIAALHTGRAASKS
jgi:demethylmenaquinone methyltransferase/2-methoxy-6-polyprenyl-1,4-benzoquinol methylase